MDEEQAEARRLIQTMISRTGWNLTRLAKEAGLAPSTLTRFMNSPVKFTSSARTLAKLSKVTGVPVPMGVPPADKDRTELLAAFDATDDEGRRMLLRIARGLTPPKAEKDDLADGTGCVRRFPRRARIR